MKARYSELLQVKVTPTMATEIRRIAERDDRSISGAARRLLARALEKSRVELGRRERTS